jgi:hypothetical protein
MCSLTLKRQVKMTSTRKQTVPSKKDPTVYHPPWPILHPSFQISKFKHQLDALEVGSSFTTLGI